MSKTSESVQSVLFLDRSQLDHLIRTLTEDGYQVVGPTVDQEAIVYDEIFSASDLPWDGLTLGAG